MSDQTVLIDQFLSSVISTIHPDEIFDSIIDTAVRLLSPDGLLLTIRDDVSPSYHVTRSFGDITWEKDSFLDSSILLEQLLNADSYIPFMPGAGLPTALDGVSSHTRSWLIQQNIIGVYCLKYNRHRSAFSSSRGTITCHCPQIRCPRCARSAFMPPTHCATRIST